MQVDWITTTAQLVNFLILVYLLKRFLYAPVLAAVDRRQARITAQLDRAAERERVAARAEEDYRKRLEDMELTRSQAMARLEHEVASERGERMTALREELAQTRERWHEAIDRERERFVSALSAQSAALTFELVRRTLIDLADESLEERIVQRFLASLESMDGERRELIRSASGAIEIRTAFDLDSSMRDRVRTALQGALSVDRSIEFQRAPALVCGIELIAGHARMGWNVQSHLEQLARKASDALARSTGPLNGGDTVHDEGH